MKRTASISLLVLLISGTLPICAAQHDNQQGSSQSEKSTKKTIRIAGRVGPEGKTLVSDRDNRIWKVLNPDLLSAIEGRLVTIKAYSEAKSSEIRITVVRLRDERTTVKLGDSAFRR
ncbi:MAG TPA: hypothetical protein VHM88_23955 [Candidatus Acidoferrales bacterium]|jgi:hypothetical protein|nr:hypothetical protein [Candidatus Acidoferrales bacterium]